MKSANEEELRVMAQGVKGWQEKLAVKWMDNQRQQEKLSSALTSAKADAENMEQVEQALLEVHRGTEERLTQLEKEKDAELSHRIQELVEKLGSEGLRSIAESASPEEIRSAFAILLEKRAQQKQAPQPQEEPQPAQAEAAAAQAEGHAAAHVAQGEGPASAPVTQTEGPPQYKAPPPQLKRKSGPQEDTVDQMD